MSSTPLVLSPQQALTQSEARHVILIDVRTPDEWTATGLAPHAHAVCMSDPDFMTHLERLTKGDVSKPIAVICAAGGRSGRIQTTLTQAGYTHVYNVLEGMTGGQHGVGWVAGGLPTVSYSA